MHFLVHLHSLINYIITNSAIYLLLIIIYLVPLTVFCLLFACFFCSMIVPSIVHSFTH